MSADTPRAAEMAAETDASLQYLLENEGRNLMIVGGILGVLGIGAILFPLVSSLTVAVFFGAALTVAGFVHVAHAFSASGWKGALGEVILALVYLVAGIVMLVNPIFSLATLTLLVIGYFFVEGLVLLYFAWSLRNERGWLWAAGAGLLSLVLAGMLFAGFPSTAVWALGLLFGVNLLSTGVSMIVVGNGARTAQAETTTAAAV